MNEKSARQVDALFRTLNYVIDVLAEWTKEAEKSKNWERWSLYNTLLTNIRKLITIED